MLDWSSILGFQWDEGNDSKSTIKHHIGCREAESVFVATDLRVLEDIKHSSRGEQRYHAYGTSSLERPLSVTFTIRNHLIRVVSARPMNQRERKIYGYQKKQ
jgi:uncharacterized DUF497 family protein